MSVQEQNPKQTFHYTQCTMSASAELALHISVTLLQGFANAAYKELNYSLTF